MTNIVSGEYEVISDVKIRREPQIVERYENGKLVSNQVGFLKVGTKKIVYSVLTKKDNTTWGRISEHDAAGIAEWVCIQGLNRTYLKLLKASNDDSTDISFDMLLMKHERELERLKEWARTQGYTG